MPPGRGVNWMVHGPANRQETHEHVLAFIHLLNLDQDQAELAQTRRRRRHQHLIADPAEDDRRLFEIILLTLSSDAYRKRMRPSSFLCRAW